MWTCVEVVIDGWAEIAVQPLPSTPLLKPSAMAMPSVMEMSLWAAVEVEVGMIVVLVEGVLRSEKLLRRAHVTVLRDSMAPWRTITLRLFRANA